MRLPRYEFKTLKARLLVWMVALVLLPVLLLVGIGLNFAERQLQARVMEDLSDASLRLQYELNLAVVSPVEDIRIFSRSPYLQSALKRFSAVYEASNLYSMAYQDEQDKFWTYLSFYAEKHDLKDLLLINLQGDIVFSAAQSELYGKNLTHIDFMGTGIQSAFKQSLWQMDSTIAVGRADDDGAYAYMASPVVGKTLQGTVMLIPGESAIRQFITTDGQNKQVFSIYRKDSQQHFKELFGKDVIEANIHAGRLMTSAGLGQSYLGDLSGNSTRWDGDWLVSIRALPVLDAVVVVRKERNYALAAIHELRSSAWVVTFVILFLTVVISRNVSASLSSPVFKLSQSIDRISNGERDVKVDVDRSDELGTLAQQFNAMALSLKSTQAQLVQSEKIASIGHLAAGVAHEINNPMSIVNANMCTMQEYTATYVKLVEIFDRYVHINEEDTEQRSQVGAELSAFESEEDIQFVHQDMKALLEDSMLGLSRVTHIVSSLKIFSELDKSENQDVDLQEIISFLISELSFENSRRVEISQQIELDGTVSIKPEQMRRVFSVVIDNAIRACSEKGSLLIRAKRQNKNLLIEFQDTGCGMDDEQINKVFDPFYTTRVVGEGIGLGLSIAHSIVAAHGGRIQVASKKGRGTKVRIVLPER
ncbi:MAG: ATP-binding protein [Thalassolituus sp.]